jgi:hemerythrin-like domain-containing protein
LTIDIHRQEHSRRAAIIAGTGAAMFPAIALSAQQGTGPGQEKEVGAVEDLMREHGVLRRALLVYIETVPKIRTNPEQVAAAALNRTAQLFRHFGEDYHERRLEEPFIFPTVKKAGGSAAGYINTLLEQHRRGREITDYIVAMTRTGKIRMNDAEALARVLSNFVLMYQNHTAREDTIVFPAWKTAISSHQLDELGDKFEEIEKQQFGTDGFEKAVAEIGDIEQRLGLLDLAQFTPAPPPKAA